MDVREKLIELIAKAKYICSNSIVISIKAYRYADLTFPFAENIC